MATTLHPYFRPTTAAQRRILFETWEATGDVQAACRRAHVGRSTFYAWKPRYAADQVAGIASCQSRAPHHPQRLAASVVAEVRALHEAQPGWGKVRLAGAVAQQHGGHAVVSPNTVQRILHPPETAPTAEREEVLSARHAEQPGQTINVDLAFLPLTHTLAEHLPAVSGSSGKLLVARPPTPRAETPGQELLAAEDYATGMCRYAEAQRASLTMGGSAPTTPVLQEARPSCAARRQAELALRAQRRTQRAQRRAEDDAVRQARATLTAEAQAEARERHAAVRATRQAQLAQRRLEDEAWRAQRQAIRTQQAVAGTLTVWVAVLVVVDNCTRQSYGLPLFANGRHLTAALVVAALQQLLPPGVQFVISDRGSHFTAGEFNDLEKHREFVHVFTPRHRPQANGVAERFVRTFKTWLQDKSWQSLAELETLSAQFQAEYNACPHQGVPIPGLSPNELQKRIWLM